MNSPSQTLSNPVPADTDMAPVANYASYPCLDQKRVLITGGGTGIGATMVAAFASQGARVFFLDIDSAASSALALALSGANIAPVFHHCDVTDLAALATCLETIERSAGPIEILINNAANDTRHAIEDVSPRSWEASMAVNLRHHFFCAQFVVPGMRPAGGVILNLGSISWHRALPDLTLYMTAKAAIEGLTRGLAKDLGKDRIRVNSIIPGAVRTPKQTMLWHTPDIEAKILEGQCLQQRVEAEDVAAMALFLASDNAARCTGRDYFVDAGWYGA
jgi:NAD(P)-dependent dehydrogenase (short-subunit alcohol dehydrogenase family)